MKKELASALMVCCRAYNNHLNMILNSATDDCTTQEFEALRDAVGEIMGASYVKIMLPITKEHPELEPSEFKESST
jgi:hypothetical protein